MSKDGGFIMINLVEVSSRKLLKEFVKFPIDLYSQNPYYVPGIISDEMDTFDQNRNPAYDFCESKLWIVKDHGKTVGRIAAIVNRKAIEKYGEMRGRFGYLDFIDDENVSRLLFETAEHWLTGMGIEVIQGPLGFSDLDEEGLLTEGFDEIGSMTTIYNHAYYQGHLESLGYIEDVRWMEYEGQLQSSPDPKIARLSKNLLNKYDLRVVDLKKSKDVLPYANQFFELINRSYSELYNITQLNEKQMKYYTKKYFTFIKADFVKLIVDQNNQLISFGLGFPSLSLALQKAKGKLLPFGILHIYRAFKTNDKVEMLLIAVDPSYSRKGIPAILFNEFFQSFEKNGIRYAYFNPQLEDNLAVRNLWRNYPLRQHRKRSCFVKKIDGR